MVREGLLILHASNTRRRRGQITPPPFTWGWVVAAQSRQSAAKMCKKAPKIKIENKEAKSLASQLFGNGTSADQPTHFLFALHQPTACDVVIVAV